MSEFLFDTPDPTGLIFAGDTETPTEPTTEDEEESPSMIRFDITSGNIKSNPLMPQPYVVDDIIKAMNAGGIVWGQEITPDRYKNAWIRHAKTQGLESFNTQSEIPISINTAKWVNLTARLQKTSDGHGGAYASPTRYNSIVLASRGGFALAFVNKHMIQKPGATKQQGDLWRTDRHITQTLLADLHNQGRTIIFGGDINKTNPPSFIEGQQTLVERGLDHIWIKTAPGVTHKVLDRNILQGHTDHPIIRARVELRRG